MGILTAFALLAGIPATAIATNRMNLEEYGPISAGMCGAYDATEALTLRGGYNYGKNPVPDQYVNALFPAIVEHHITVGAGYDWAEVNGINCSFQTGLESNATNPGNGSSIPPVESTHKQYNWQLMYSRSF